MIRQIEIQIEARQIAILLPLDFIDVKLREHHTALRMIGVRQRQEAWRENIALSGFGADADKQHALAVGFDGHLTKPTGLAELQAALAN